MHSPVAIGMRQGDIAFQAQLYEAQNPTRRWLHIARRDWVMKVIRDYLSSSRRVLEVGVGAGLFTRYLSEQSCQVLAIDINPTFLHAVANLPGIQTREVDVAALTVEGFDMAVCSEVLEHLRPEHSLIALQRMFAALRPGGVLVLTTPQSFSTMEIFARMLRNPVVLALAKRLYGAVDELGHINLLTRSALRQQLRETGFLVRDHDLLGLYIPVLAEFGGSIGQLVAAKLAKLLRHVPVLSGLLWTQCYVLVRPKAVS